MEKSELETLKEENNLLKSLLKQSNMFCSSLMQSNQILTSQITDIEIEVENKFTLLSMFLTKKGFSLEDVLEFENELRLSDK